MAYGVINKTGCCERKGNVQIRLDFYLEPGDPRYAEQLITVIEGGKKRTINTPFHSHFIYYDPDVSESDIQNEIAFHLPNFYKAFQAQWDKVPGGMRHGFAVEKRIPPLDYSLLDTKKNHELRKEQCKQTIERLPEIQYKPNIIENGKEFPATTIDVGPGAISTSYYLDNTNMTNITTANSANATGIIDTVEVYAHADMSNVKAAMFYGSSTTYTGRDAESIGTVTSGAKRTFTGLSIEVETGDYIGIYATAGQIKRTDSGGAKVYAKDGDYTTSTGTFYWEYSGFDLSLYATGETIDAPTITLSNATNITGSTARLPGNVTDTGGQDPTVTVYWGNNDGAQVAGDWDNYSAPTSPSQPQGVAAFYKDVSGLPGGTLIYFKAKATNYGGTTWTATKSFYTHSESAANIAANSTLSASSLVYKYATANIGVASALTALSFAYKYASATIEATSALTAKAIIKKRYPPGTVAVTGIQYGEVLSRGRVPPYSKAIGDGYTVSQVLQDFLDYQETARITLGTVSATLDQVIAISIDDWPTILEACRRVRDIVGGYLDVEIDSTDSSVRELTLRDSIGSNTGQEIRLAKNLSSIVHTQDWMKYANKLIAVGKSNLLLSTKTYTDVTVNQETDATYARLKLQQLYGAYEGWTGDGDAVPAHVTITKPTGAWATPFTGHSASGWSSPENAYDDDLNTLSQQGAVYSGGIAPGASSTEFIATCPATTTNKIRVWLTAANQLGAIVVPITIKAQIGGSWTTIFTGYPGADAFNAWYTVDIGSSESITGVSIQFYNWTSYQMMVRIYEIATWDTTGSADDTVNWTQGEDERTFKQAIALYDDVPHLVSYTHAPYVINVDELLDDSGDVDRDRVAAAVLSIDTDDVDELLMRALTALEEDFIPNVTVDMGMIDLSVVEGIDFEKLALGNTVKIIHGGLGISELVQIYGITQNLNDPADIKVEIGNIKDILDAI